MVVEGHNVFAIIIYIGAQCPKMHLIGRVIGK